MWGTVLQDPKIPRYWYTARAEMTITPFLSRFPQSASCCDDVQNTEIKVDVQPADGKGGPT